MAGVQCLKRLYWQVHYPELAAEPAAADKAIIEQGREVGLLACRMFPEGVEAAPKWGGLDEAIRATRELVANREGPTIFEGVFEHDGVCVTPDILDRGTWLTETENPSQQPASGRKLATISSVSGWSCASDVALSPQVPDTPALYSYRSATMALGLRCTDRY